jgi:type I restriction enzyme S subunit
MYLLFRGSQVRSTHIGQGKIVDRDFVRISNSLSMKLKRSRLCKGDVVYPCVGSIGNATVIDEDNKYHIQQNIARITPASMLISSRYLANYLMSILGMREVERFNSSSSQPSVLVGNLRQYRIALPATKAEQEVIASHLADVDALIAGLEKLIAKKRDIKQAAMQQLLTGQTRLPGFSGEWAVKRLGDLAEMGSGGTPSSANAAFYGGEIPWVAIADMTGGGKYISSTEKNLSVLGLANSAAQMFPAGAVLYAMYASLGECSIATVPVTTSQAILGIRPKADLHSEFLYYVLTSWKSMVKGLGQQGTQANLNKGIVADFKISLPALEEQISIAAVLIEMDTELVALESRLAKTHELKQGMMQELLTGKTRLV